MLLLASALAIASIQQAQAATPAAAAAGPKAAAPVVDRSAEPALKELFAQSGALRDIHITVEIYPREDFAQRFDDDSSMDLWMGDGNRFRFQTNANYWGGGNLFVSDGDSLLSDDLSDDGSIHISAPKKTLHELSDQEPILYALEGQAGLDALADKDQPLKLVSAAGGGDSVIEVHSKKVGKVLFHYHQGSSIPSEIDIYQAQWWMPDPTAVPDKPSECEILRVVSQGPIDSKLFVVSGPKGKKVIDDRAKK